MDHLTAEETQRHATLNLLFKNGYATFFTKAKVVHMTEWQIHRAKYALLRSQEQQQHSVKSMAT